MGEYDTGGRGRLLAGRYRVTGQLGRGGMGTVWRAVDERLGREVAVKELRTYCDSDGRDLAEMRLRTEREARAAARVRHPGVVAVHDVTEHEGRPVIVMELVDGPSLDDVLREHGSVAPADAAAIGVKVLDALDAAHRAGVLHRDVKPGNILLERSGRVVLTDFGIAAMEEPADGANTRLTRSGELVGSLDYLAPERARGDQPGPPSDVWSLGATLYAAVEGISPFHRTSTWSTITAIIVEPLPEPQRAGPLGPALRELLTKDPAERPGTARATELLRAVAAGGAAAPTAVPSPSPDTVRLGRASQGQFGPPPPPSAPEEQGRARTAEQTAPQQRRPRRRRALIAAAAAAAVLLAGGGVTYLTTRDGGTETTAGAGEKRDDAPQSPRPETSEDDGKSEAPDDEPKGSLKPSPDGSASPTEAPAGTAGGSSGGDGSGGSGGSDGSGDDTGGSSGGDDSSGGSDTGSGGTTSGGSDGGGSAPPPSCHSIGGGKYNCEVWRTATSYDSAHRAVGTLYAGTNYFYCQVKLTYRETYGEWTNVWWAKTDDDKGNVNVYVSDVYIKGGDNDAPVPGLPVC